MYAADLKHPNETLEDKLFKLYHLRTDKTVVLGFREPYLKLLEAFGNPHDHLPPTIHIAGTNGKGSIVATLRALLEAGDYHVHAYTSPHLTRYNERMYLAGEHIDDDALEKLVDEALALNADKETTFFEITTALAFAAFQRNPADVLLLETGLGGRLDCTNIIKKPAATIISNISYDHMKFLGETLPEIAAEKAGIMKKDTPCIIGPQRSKGVLSVFENKAKDLGICLYRHGSEWRIEPHGADEMRFTMDKAEIILPRPNLVGDHQIENAGSALAALHVLQKNFPWQVSVIQKGLTQINWPGRMQLLKPKDSHLAQIASENWELWFDGGHNDTAGDALEDQIKKWKAQDGKLLHIILGMRGDKNARDFLDKILPHAESFCLVEIHEIGSFIGPDDLSDIIKKYPDKKFRHFYNIEKALEEYRQTLDPQTPRRFLICGSLYLGRQIFKTSGIKP